MRSATLRVNPPPFPVHSTSTRTIALQRLQPTLPPPAPPVLVAAMSPSSATAVSASSSTAVAVAGAVNPSAANKGANLANILGSVSCQLSSSDLQTSAAQTIITVSIGAGAFRELIGGTVTSLGFVLGIYSWQYLLWKLFRHRRSIRRYSANAGSLLIGFLLPNVASFGTTMAIHGDSSSVRGFAFLAFAGMFTVFAGPLYVVLAKVPSLRHMANADEFVDHALFPYFILAEGAVDTTRLSSRVFFFEDLAVALVLGVIGGWHPDSGSCTVVACLTLVVALLHTAYVCRRKVISNVDFGFSVLIAVGQDALAVAALVMIQMPDNGVVASATGYLALAMSASFMMQAVISVGMWIQEHRRRRAERLEKRALEISQAKSQYQAGLLSLPDDVGPKEAMLPQSQSKSGDCSDGGDYLEHRNPLDKPRRSSTSSAPPPPPPPPPRPLPSRLQVVPNDPDL